MKWIKWTIAAAVGVATAAGVAASLRTKPIRVESASVARGRLRVTIDEDGRTRVQDRHIVTAPLTGNLARIDLEPGNAVTEGLTVALIEPIPPPLLDARANSELEARVHVAEASARQASAAVGRAETRKTFTSRQLTRLRKLASDGAASQEEIDTAELDAEAAARELDAARFGARVARFEVDTAKAALARSAGGSSTEQFEIHSPIVGTVLRVLRESEGLVTAGAPLMELADPHALEIVVDVLTADAVEIEPGDAVEIQRWGGEQPLQGHVRLVSPSAFTKVSSLGVEEQRVDVIVSIDDPYERWQQLGDGYAVIASIVVWEQDDAVTVPTASLVRDDEGWALFVIADGVATRRKVGVGRRGATAVQITEGVTPGEVIVMHPSDRIAEGVAIEPL
ncbi:MAG: efflux RND transporter periplasmic adaptor subunit [Deltaproteobacteria bacterium]|nr:efflux RND transporter periplasmic adaptor subunit [Deltaproteobacteria bacterium]